MKNTGLTEQQIQRRKLGIGGSDARIIANGTQEDWHSLWLQKTGQEEPKFDMRSKFLMALGNATEHVTLDRLNKEVPIYKPELDNDSIEKYKKALERIHEEYKFMRCNLDGLTDSTRQPIEVKFHTGNKSFAELADFYAPQLQHNMMCSTSTSIVFAVTFGHYGTFKWELFKADYDWQGHYIEKAIKFWDMVEKKLPPYKNFNEDNIGVPDHSMLKTIDMTKTKSSNAWTEHAVSWLINRPYVQKFKDAEKELKSLVPKQANIAIGNGIQIKRARNNRLTITENDLEDFLNESKNMFINGKESEDK